MTDETNEKQPQTEGDEPESEPEETPEPESEPEETSEPEEQAPVEVAKEPAHEELADEELVDEEPEGPPPWENPPGPEAVSLEVTYRAEDLAAPSRWNMTRGGWLVRRLLSGVFNILIGAFLWFDPFGMGSTFEFGWLSWLWMVVQWSGLLAMILGGLLAFRLGYTVWVIKRSPEKLWPGVRQQVANARFAVDRKAFRLGMEQNQKTYEWSEIRRVERWKAWYLVETEAGEWIIVPQRAFGAGQEDAFVDLVREAGAGGELSTR